ncbi:MAG: cytochrome bd ubiquinol oxidase subunit [Mycobacterium sp.]|jgi:cytochrome d ubiquinol oxidase subunit II|nr:cytochrome bd ubiquinol oxidase subunit [Mycobacterium sp.]
MILADAVAVAMFAGIIAYTLFAGADFGSGYYVLTAGGGVRGKETRTLVDHGTAPVWAANNVWLIFVLLTWWTAFPTAFAAAMTTLFIPLVLALTGIVLRGANFAFRRYTATFENAGFFGAIFAAASVITPFFLGTVAGAIASGRVPAGGYGDPIGSWINPTSLVGGCLAVTTCIFLAGVFLTADGARTGHPELVERLRKRTLVMTVVAGVIVFAGLGPVLHDAPSLSRGLLGAGLPVPVLAAAAGTTTLVLLYRRMYSIARPFAAAAVGAVVAGWGVGQYPWILVDQLTITQAATADATLGTLGVVEALNVATALPLFGYLLRLTPTDKSDRT